MTVHPTKAEYLDYAKKGNLIPVYSDLMADFETPVSVYSKLRRRGPAFLLESVEGGANLNRYSFIGCQPEKIISVGPDRTIIRRRTGEETSTPTPPDPLTVIEEEMAAYEPVNLPGMPRFVGGAVGYIGYEYAHILEPTVPWAPSDPVSMPLLHFMLTDTVVIFDRANQTLRLLINAHIGDDPEEAYENACLGIEQLIDILQERSAIATIPVIEGQAPEIPPGNLKRREFEALVEKSIEYIRAGDNIQVVLSQRFEHPFPQPALDLYRALRTVNPSPYMLLYDNGEFALVGASPEVHVRLTNGLAEMRPIAGTRPRGTGIDEDLDLEKDLLADEKERAEHLMLVDLARNDLGRVCEFGSVTVPEHMIVERYSHVMHIVSQVEGRLRSDKDGYDLMRATFPAGTVSGAPKVRAMQIISELEKEARGPYAGAAGYFSYDHNLDFCITIRTALLKDNRVFIQSGAGLVADSRPSTEYDETVNKAKGLLKAVALAERIQWSADRRATGSQASR